MSFRMFIRLAKVLLANLKWSFVANIRSMVVLGEIYGLYFRLRVASGSGCCL